MFLSLLSKCISILSFFHFSFLTFEDVYKVFRPLFIYLLIYPSTGQSPVPFTRRQNWAASLLARHRNQRIGWAFWLVGSGKWRDLWLEIDRHAWRRAFTWHGKLFIYCCLLELICRLVWFFGAFLGVCYCQVLSHLNDFIFLLVPLFLSVFCAHAHRALFTLFVTCSSENGRCASEQELWLRIGVCFCLAHM